MSYVDRIRFNLFIPAGASPERRAAHSRYVAAMEASWAAKGADVPAAWKAVENTHRAYGLVLLREDKERDPQRYAA